jgi:hypothetical protein
MRSACCLLRAFESPVLLSLLALAGCSSTSPASVGDGGAGATGRDARSGGSDAKGPGHDATGGGRDGGATGVHDAAGGGQDGSSTANDATTDGQAASHDTGSTVGRPGAPTAVKAFSDSPGMEAAYVVFAAPSDNGGAPITEYTATANPGGHTGVSKRSDFFNSSINGVSARVYVEGLTGGTAYTFTVTATNANGTGPASDASNSVTPIAYAPFYIYNAATYPSGGVNPLWSNYDYGGTFDYTSTAVAAPAGFGSFVLLASGSGSGYQPFVQHQNPFHPALLNQNNGQFDLSPFTYLSAYIYPTASGQDFDTYVEYQVLFCGVATAASADSIVDSTQSWTPNTVMGGTGALWWNDTAGGWGGITGNNTATTQPTQSGSTAFNVGDYYEFGPADQSIGTHVNSVAPYVKTPTAGSFTANTWNFVEIPLTAYDSPGATNVSKGRILKFGMQNQGPGTNVYYAGVGFTR